VHLAAEREEFMGGRDLVERLAACSPLVTVGEVPARADLRWFTLATSIRRALDYLTYSGPLYDDAPKIRERAWERTPQWALPLSRWPVRSAVEPGLAALDRSLPTDAALDDWLDRQQPDVVLLTPLIELGSPQMDLLESARRKGLRTAVAVWSWDHLTSKARLRRSPDRVFVWNDVQREEAATLHGVPRDRIVVTGAQCFDRWFDRPPRRSREEFCRDAGLDARRPFITYVCSALFRGGPSEAEFACRWAEQVRGAASPSVREAGILIRPHPQRMYEWDGVSVPDGVAFRGGHPIDESGRDEYYDALYHASAVVGLNTSALIEAAIVGRPVLTLLLPEFHESQRGTLHFRYLVDGDGAMLHASTDMTTHVAQLEQALAGTLPDRNAAFVRRFVRPRGADVAATPVFVDALEALAETPAPAPARVPLSGRVLLPLANVWYGALDRPRVRSWMLEAGHAQEERDRTTRLETKQARIRVRDEERRARATAKENRYRVKRRRRRVAQLKTMVRRLLTAGPGGGDVRP
jgi:hypothetical protein